MCTQHRCAWHKIFTKHRMPMHITPRAKVGDRQSTHKTVKHAIQYCGTIPLRLQKENMISLAVSTAVARDIEVHLVLSEASNS
mmetsp:Transcript_146582/g.267250  ORF Transcript_146582/g.267250 Transcript_146582/m.267250 type:complete len:83 (+) Transcript_146582:26-274(+)